MTKINLGDPRDVLRSHLVVDDDRIYRTRTDHDIARMATHVSRELDDNIAEQLVDKMLARFARRAHISPEVMMELITYMVQDEAFMERFIAHRAAERIIGGPVR